MSTSLVLDSLLAPDVFVNASVALGSAPEQVTRRVFGRPEKPRTTPWVLRWIETLLAKTPDFKHEAVEAQMKTIRALCEVADMAAVKDESDWVKGLVASAKATGYKRVVTDHPDLADKAEVDGVFFLSSDAWLLEAQMPPPPPPKAK